MIGLKTKNTVSECLYFLFIMSIQCTYYFTGAISIPIKLALELILVVLKRKIKVNLFVKWAILMVVIAATSGIFSGYNDCGQKISTRKNSRDILGVVLLQSH